MLGSCRPAGLQNMLYHVATWSVPPHRPPRLYPQSTPCDATAPAPAPCNPGKFHGSLSLSFHRALAPRQRLSKTDGDDGDDSSCCASFQPRKSLQRPLKGLMMDRPENAVVHPLGWGRGAPARLRIRGGHVLSSGGDCTPLHGGTLAMPHPHPRNKAHQAVMSLAGFRTGIRVSQMDCHGKGVHGAVFRGRIAGAECIVEPSPN